MRFFTSATVALVVGAVEILNVVISLIEMEPEIFAAIGADQQARKHILLALYRLALTGFVVALTRAMGGISQSMAISLGFCL